MYTCINAAYFVQWVKGVVDVPISEAKRRSNKKWNDENIKDYYDRVNFVVKKGLREKIKSHAESKGMGISEYIKKLISADMGGIEL